MFDNQNQPNNNPPATPSNLPFGKPQSPFASAPATSAPTNNSQPIDSGANQIAPNPQSSSNQIEDMFSAVETQTPPQSTNYQPTANPIGQPSSANPSVNTPFMPANNQNYSTSPYPYNSFSGRTFPWAKLITITLIFLLTIGLLLGGYFLFSFWTNSNNSTNNNQTNNQNANTPNNQQPVDTQNNQPTTTDQIQGGPVTIVESETDTDGDGLLDMQEEAYKTDPKNSDTDGDGLTDYFEITVYKTDPLNPDTDGDGYKDGEEVINGYDPNKVGARLFEVPQE